MEERTLDGETMYVDPEDDERGSKGPFYGVYRSPDDETRYTWFCTNCETTDNAMDTMGRIQCNVCNNLHKPEEWDAAHE